LEELRSILGELQEAQEEGLVQEEELLQFLLDLKNRCGG